MLFDEDGHTPESLHDKLEAHGYLEGPEALAILAASFANATHGNYSAEKLFERACLSGHLTLHTKPPVTLDQRLAALEALYSGTPGAAPGSQLTRIDADKTGFSWCLALGGRGDRKTCFYGHTASAAIAAAEAASLDRAPEPAVDADSARVADELLETARSLSEEGVLDTPALAEVERLLNPSDSPAALLADDVTLYLLFRTVQSVQWSLDRATLDRALEAYLASGATLACPSVLSCTIAPSLAKQLEMLQCLETETPYILSAAQRGQLAKAVEAERQSSLRHPERRVEDGLRVYITVLNEGTGRWSPSGNNINGIIANAPVGTFLCPAGRVALTETEHAALYGFFSWACDNF